RRRGAADRRLHVTTRAAIKIEARPEPIAHAFLLAEVRETRIEVAALRARQIRQRLTCARRACAHARIARLLGLGLHGKTQRAGEQRPHENRVTAKHEYPPDDDVS